jgi:hypothetical protein
MELRHRLVAFSNSREYALLERKLQDIGCPYRVEGKTPPFTIVAWLSDDDPRSTGLMEFANTHGIVLTSGLYYTEEEIAAAEWVVVEVGEFQYPQPEDAYLSQTYDLSDYCRRCGQGLVQSHPFRLKREFSQRQARFLGLHWVLDEVFVRPEVKRTFERAQVSGVTYAEVIHHKTGQPLQNVYQMKINEIAPPGLITDQLFRVSCRANNEEFWEGPAGLSREGSIVPYCGRVKYHYPRTRPFQFRSNALADLPDFAKSGEYHGSGAAAFRLIMARARVLSIVRSAGLKGLGAHRPVHLV